MLSNLEIKEIKEHLEKAQNPIFFFDNDSDGLCSFLLLQRYIGRGKGVCIKSFPSLDRRYLHKVEELNADYIFILDKPEVSTEFWEAVEKINIPVVWIDHHEMNQKIPDFVNYYNSLKSSGNNTPVTVLCYEVSQKKDDLWLAVAGAIADCFLPNYYSEFEKKYPDLGVKAKTAFEVLYKSEIGRLSRMINDGLKDTTTNVVSMLKFLMKAKSPYEVLKESSENARMHQRVEEIEKKYSILLNKARNSIGKEKVLFFKYSGDMRVNGELANELCFIYPSKIIIVAYIGGTKVNLSLRGKNILDAFEKVIPEIKNGYGGGHKNAVGGQLFVDDLDKFVKRMKEEVS